MAQARNCLWGERVGTRGSTGVQGGAMGEAEEAQQSLRDDFLLLLQPPFPRAAQVLRRLEPHLHQQEAFASMAERNRQKQAQKRQHPW